MFDTDIPVPTYRKWPFKKMEIGQSYLLTKEESISGRAAAFSLATRDRRYKFLTRKEGDGVRVWRINLD